MTPFFLPVTLIASTPSYFRGFTLIALKEGAEGDKDEDYSGNFQVMWLIFITDISSEWAITSALSFLWTPAPTQSIRHVRTRREE